jgi:hypothetical protein
MGISASKVIGVATECPERSRRMSHLSAESKRGTSRPLLRSGAGEDTRLYVAWLIPP